MSRYQSWFSKKRLRRRDSQTHITCRVHPDIDHDDSRSSFCFVSFRFTTRGLLPSPDPFRPTVAAFTCRPRTRHEDLDVLQTPRRPRDLLEPKWVPAYEEGGFVLPRAIIPDYDQPNMPPQMTDGLARGLNRLLF